MHEARNRAGCGRRASAPRTFLLPFAFTAGVATSKFSVSDIARLDKESPRTALHSAAPDDLLVTADSCFARGRHENNSRIRRRGLWRNRLHRPAGRRAPGAGLWRRARRQMG